MDKRRQVIIRGMQDGDDRIRSTAAEAMERLEIRQRLASLEKLIDSGAKVEKLRAVYALATLRGADVIKLLSKAAVDEMDDVRSAAVRVMGRVADRRGVPALVERLADENPMVVRTSIEALANFRDPQLLPPLMKMLKNKDPGVVERALDVVGRSGDKRTEEAMIYFSSKGNAKMKTIAIRALGMMEG